MGTLMSVDTLVVDCTEMRYETDMFGPKHPYQGSADGSPLNNYLAQQSGGRNIVVLDEFEKTTDNVRRALLLAFDSGTFLRPASHPIHPPTNQTPIAKTNRSPQANTATGATASSSNCTRTIWVLATNHGSDTIVKFHNDHLKEQPDCARASAPLARLDSTLKKEFTAEMGAPMTGRFTLIVAVLPFHCARTGRRRAQVHPRLRRQVAAAHRPAGQQVGRTRVFGAAE